MTNQAVFSIRHLLDRELEQRCYVSGINLKAEELFDRSKLLPWINALVGQSVSDKLADCITKTSDARLSHAAAAYLLGMAIRSNLQLHFDLMPRIIAHSASDGFHFFWAVICLCHDLGYRFENESAKDKQLLQNMTTARGRLEWLGIQHNLFEVDRAELFALGIDPDSDEGKWILESVELTKKYDRYRRQTRHSGEYPPVADHGVCGALLLYDILRTEYDQIRLKRRMRRFNHTARHAVPEPKGNLDGAAKDASPTRFIRCSLLIALTVARHNMWLASNDDQKAVYRLYGLEQLYADTPGAKIQADNPMEQMLFFLDYVDTIDPAKWFYLRDVENGPKEGESIQDCQDRLTRQYHFMMDRVMVDFSGFAGHRFSLMTVSEDSNEKTFFEAFSNSAKGLPDWLETAPPLTGINQITFEIPFPPGVKNNWSCGILDSEVNALLLYMGCGVPGMYGAFYSSSRAYQTFNLLMMDGTAGEEVRVCQEKQKPNGIFVREWERSLEVMADIFRAQCKYARDPQTPAMTDVLFRGDRRTNFRMMRAQGTTYAMTSTSRGSYLEDFLADKVEPHILRIRLKDRVPFFDYEDFFQDQYVYADEREVLLPPMIPMRARWVTDRFLCLNADDPANGTLVRCYDITLQGFDLHEPNVPACHDPEQYLTDHADEAAAALNTLAATHDMTAAGLSDPSHVYWTWKRCYQYLLRKKFQEIYLHEFHSA